MAIRGKWGTKKQLALQDKALVDALKFWMVKQGLTHERAAHRLGMSESTFNRRLARPRDFTLCELRRVFGEIGFTGAKIHTELFGEWEVR